MSDQPDLIEYTPTGQIIIHDEQETYRLSRPKMGQWRWFRRRYDEAIQARKARTVELSGQVQALIDSVPLPHDSTNPAYVAVVESDEYQRLRDEIAAEAEALRDSPIYDVTLQWLADVFDQLAEPKLPGDPDEWPSFLADPQLPGEFLKHWQTVPKASGRSENSR